MASVSSATWARPLRDAPFLARPPITVGETLIYDVKLGWVLPKAGQQLLQVINETVVNGQTVYQLRSEAIPDSRLDSVYHFSDRKVSYIGVDDYLPVRYEKRIEDRTYVGDFVAEFDREKRTAAVWKNGKRQKDYYIPADVLDELSMVYFFRAKELRAGESYEYSFFTGAKLLDVTVKVLRMEYYTAPAPMGRIKVYRMQTSQGYTVLVTADRYRIPVQIEAPVPGFGKLVAKLRTWDGIPNFTKIATEPHSQLKNP